MPEEIVLLCVEQWQVLLRIHDETQQTASAVLEGNNSSPPASGFAIVALASSCCSYDSSLVMHVCRINNPS
ncbi:MAG: hypothetical protein AAF579_03340 [Cyanobacteria bacterium P01_C01_bin.118]